TGDFAGTTSFNPIPVDPPDVPVPAVIHIQPNGDPNVTGSIDPTTGEAALTASVILTVDVPEITISCSTPAFDIEFTTEPPDGAPLAPIPFDPDADYTMSLASETFEVPPV